MSSLDTLTAFFGWTTVINLVFLAVSTIIVIAMRESISKYHGKMFGLEYVGRIDGVLMGAYITCDVQIVGTSDGAVLSRIAHQNAARVPDPCEMTNLLCSVIAAP